MLTTPLTRQRKSQLWETGSRTSVAEDTRGWQTSKPPTSCIKDDDEQFIKSYNWWQR